MITPDQRIKDRYKKQTQREKQRAWLLKKYNLASAEALVTKLMRMEKSNGS